MKRSIDEASKGKSQLETPAASLPTESSASEQTPMAGGTESDQKLTMTDSLLYIDVLKYRFREEKEKYDEFVQAVTAFKAERTDADSFLASVKEILEGHPDLLLGFNIFLPNENQTPVPQVEKKLLAKGVPFLTKVKETFQSEDHVYKSFADIISRKEHGSMSIKEEVAALFQHHPDLYSEFTQFLPNTLVPASNRYACSTRNYVSRNRTSAFPTTLTVLADKKDGTTTLHADPGLSMKRPKSGKGKGIVKENTEQRWLDEEERVKREDSRDRDLAISEFKENEGQLPRSVKREDRNKNQGREQDNVVKNRDKIGRRSFGKKDGTATLHADPVLSMERPKSGKGKGIVKENTEQRCLDEEERVKKEDSRDREEGDRAISEFKENEGQLPRSVKREGRNRNQGREHDNVVKNRDKIGTRSFGKKDAGSSRKAELDLSKLDLSKCEQITPSYRLLPKNYRKPIASRRSKLEDEVLNDDLVNVTSGSEDSFKHMRKNPHAEVLFRCEDDMFELDVLIETAKATTKQVEELIAKMKNNRNKMDTPIRLEEHFKVQSLRCIEKIYGEHGLEFMDMLKNTPQRALPLISTRLRQKQEDWASGRSDFNKIWAGVYAKNHDKSLDHRSFLKKQDGQH